MVFILTDASKFLFFSTLFWNSLDFGEAWNYQNVNEWGDVSATCVAGRNQSPVDLRADVVGQDNGRPPLTFLNYNSQAQLMMIMNDGHAVELTGTWSENPPSISGSAFSKEVYAFANAHVHWSTDNNNGTEHSINGTKYAAELHLVHLNTKYQNSSDAMTQPDGIAVIAILFRVQDKVAPNPGMLQLATLAQTVLQPDSVNNVTSFDVSSFIPNPVGSFYSYAGSLTTPPCTENVRWIILSEPQPINSQIINAFRQVALDDGDTDNVRPLQQIEGRLIEFFGNVKTS